MTAPALFTVGSEDAALPESVTGQLKIFTLGVETENNNSSYFFFVSKSYLTTPKLSHTQTFAAI